ncbi:MAG: hypothetical protein H0T79_22680 [Deltaproteobacteria bacterium]|nr:hypothetical protein [Deltaproteobacteria bacterium]
MIRIASILFVLAFGCGKKSETQTESVPAVKPIDAAIVKPAVDSAPPRHTRQR